MASATLSPSPLEQILVTADRTAQIIRYHRPHQLFLRAWKHIADNVSSPAAKINLGSAPPVRPFGGSIGVPILLRPTVSFADLRAGRMTLLNQTVELGASINWQLEGRDDIPYLWLFQLHYFEYMDPLLRLGPTPSDWDLLWETIAGWLDAFPAPVPAARKAAWHPYCVSRRLPIWLRMLRRNKPGGSLEARVTDSVAQQAEWLARNLERDIGGNHLWDNGRALAMAGCYFMGHEGERWRKLGLSVLEECVVEQVSPAGEHFERSPMYQSDLSRGLADLADWLAPIDAKTAYRIRKTSHAMHSFLNAIRHPDGGIPLFGDATLDNDVPVLRGQCEPNQSSRWVGDYFSHGADGNLVLFDAGDLGPDHLPAHAHCDLLGFEMSLDGERTFVDGGAYCYAGPRRNEFRSTKAHNVLMIDGEEHADIWSSFRMGRRGHVIGRLTGRTDCGHWVRAAHDAYRRLGIDRVERLWFFANDDGPWFSIHVAIGNSAREHELCEFLHWSPTIRPKRKGNAATFGNRSSSFVWESASAATTVRETPGSRSPRFGVAEHCKVYELHGRCRLPAISAWSVSFDGEPVSPAVSFDGHNLVIRWRQRQRRRETQIALREW